MGSLPTRIFPMGAGGAVPLPYDAEVEYLQTSTAGPYISIGNVTTSSALTMDVDIMANSPATDEKMFGGIEALSIGSYSNQWRIWVANSLYGVGANTSANYPRVHIVVAGGSAKFVSGSTTLITRPLTAGITKPFYAFGMGRADGTVTKGRARIYAIKINGNITRDMIPVRVGQTGYFYDRANPTGGPLGNGLYGNAGTGAFVVGPDITGA